MEQTAGIVVARIPGLTLALCVCLSRLAGAQGLPPSADRTSAVRMGQTVWVTTGDGREVHGKIGSLSATEIGVRTDRSVTPIKWTEVRLIQGRDSNLDGLMAGAIVGGLAGGLPVGLFLGIYGECPCSDSTALVARYAALGAGIGAAIGFAADIQGIGRRQLYRASASVSVAPVLLPARVGFAATVQW